MRKMKFIHCKHGELVSVPFTDTNSELHKPAHKRRPVRRELIIMMLHAGFVPANRKVAESVRKRLNSLYKLY